VASSIESIIDLLSVRHIYYSHSGASVIFCEADDLIGVVSSPSLLLMSFNYLVENTPINFFV